MSDSITLCIVKDGAAGTSINMKTGVSSPDALPSSGASIGDSYIIDGHLWTYTGGTASDATHRNGFTDCGKVSGEAGKNNYVHVAWSNKQQPTTEDDIVLSNTDGNAYAYMGTWVSETKEDKADEAVKMAKWVYVKGDKGTPGKDAVTYGVQVTPTYEVWSDAKKHAGIVLTFTKTTGSTMLKYLIVKTLGTVKVCADGTEIEHASKWINDGNSKIIFESFTFDGTNNTPTIGTASVISIELIVDDKIVATANYSNGKQGDGVVMAYKHADTQPGAPTGTDPKSPGDGWSLSPDAATAGEKVTDVRYGGYESGTYDGNNKGTDATAKEWAEAEDDGRTWMKSPSGLGVNYGYALMKVSFTTQYDNTTVDVEIKAYSEQNYDLVEVWALDTAPSTGTSFCGQGLAHASGNGVEQAYSFTVAKAGRHFICVTYAKDISGDDNGDYGLFRLDLSDNEVAVSDTVWMSQAKVSGGKCVLPWSTPVKINGADGIGAFEILCDPETIVLDTDDNGLVNDTSNAWAALMCVRDGKVVDGVTYDINKTDKNSTVNCDATVNNNGIVTITSVTSQSVTIGDNTVTVSSTSGSVTVSVTEKATGVTYTKTVPFTVNVARYTGGLKADNKKLQSQYSLLTNDGKVTNLTEYKSEILQTAKEISLHVSEKRAGRRNLLPGSAFRKQGEGCSIVQDGQDAINGICINGGYDGVNCARLRNEGNAGAAYPRISWDGARNSNVKVAKGKKYTLSFWAKRLSSTEGGYEISTQFFLQDGANGYARPYGALKFGSFTVKSQGEWEFFQDTVTIPSDAKSNYTEVCICLDLFQRGMAEILVCRPMLEEGEEYNGWTLSEQDYDYVGGNLLDNAGTLTKTGNVEVLDETGVKQGGYNNESACVKALLLPTAQFYDFLQYSTADMGLKAGEDYMLSFYARAASGYAHGELQCYLYGPSTGNVVRESSHEKINGLGNPADGRLETPITLTTAWKRYWVHWRPMGNVPKHVLFRLLRPGTDKGSYDSSTSYDVGDVVLYGGTYYVRQQAGSGHTPGASGSSSYWEATVFAIELARPKLEVGATMTEWTEKRTDMVDKQALYATGIDIDRKEMTLTANKTYVRSNSGESIAMFSASDGFINSDILNVKHVYAKDANGTVYGHFGYEDATGGTSSSGKKYPLWLGAETCDRAPFAVSSSGDMYAHSGMLGPFSIGGYGISSPSFSTGTGMSLGFLITLTGATFNSNNNNYDMAAVIGGHTAYGDPLSYLTGGGDYSDPTYRDFSTSFGYGTMRARQSLYVRKKLDSSSSPSTSVDIHGWNQASGKPYAAMIVDSDCMGVNSPSSNFFGGMACGLLRVSSLSSTNLTAWDENRVTTLVMTNISRETVPLPKYPEVGQMIWVIQQGGIVYFSSDNSHPMKTANGTGSTVTSGANSNKKGQINLFVWDGQYWNCSYINGGLF